MFEDSQDAELAVVPELHAVPAFPKGGAGSSRDSVVPQSSLDAVIGNLTRLVELQAKHINQQGGLMKQQQIQTAEFQEWRKQYLLLSKLHRRQLLPQGRLQISSPEEKLSSLRMKQCMPLMILLGRLVPQESLLVMS